MEEDPTQADASYQARSRVHLDQTKTLVVCRKILSFIATSWGTPSASCRIAEPQLSVSYSCEGGTMSL